jgi:hypothetical protein
MLAFAAKRAVQQLFTTGGLFIGHGKNLERGFFDLTRELKRRHESAQ